MKKEVKTSVDGLEVGMYVARLDRPWLKTPFALEGLAIRSTDDIDKLRKYCNFVYVDTEQGSSPDPRFWILREGAKTYKTASRPVNASNPAVVTRVDDEFTRLRKKQYHDVKPINEEMQAAQDAHERLQEDLGMVMDKLSKSNELEFETLSKSISVVVDSIIRSPGAMMLVIKLKQFDSTTYCRALGTSVWCATFGRHLGLEKSSIELLALGGLLLDVGKREVPRALLHKAGKLAEEEYRSLQGHVDYGVRMLSKSSSPTGTELDDRLPMEVLQMVATHHERADGSGYPQGLKSNEIPIFGRIAGIVDSFDAMTNTRPYSNEDPLPPHEAIAELYDLRGKLYQPELVEQFIQTVGLYPTGSLVELSSGEVGAVIEVNGLRRLCPTVMLLLDNNKEPFEQFRLVDLSRTDEDLSVKTGLPSGAYGIDMKEVFL